MIIAKNIKNLPEATGVYQYFDENYKLLYIGKAKSLKKRIKSYFRFSPDISISSKNCPRITKMLTEAKHLKYTITSCEQDALILENTLIKTHNPKYNILLRDDKTYPYIYIDMSKTFPRFEITRKYLKTNHIKYFGPFTTGAKDLLESLYDIFPLVQSNSCLKGKKACLFYQIKKCLAPCENKVSSEQYKHIIKEAMQLIYHKDKILDHLSQKMYSFSKQLKFEQAAEIKAKIGRIENYTMNSELDLLSPLNFDCISLAFDQSFVCAIRLFVRDGKVVSTAHKIIKIDHKSQDNQANIDINELYQRIFISFYSANTPCLINHIFIKDDFKDKKIIKDYLKNLYQKDIQIIRPIKGKKKALLDLALDNALNILAQDQHKNSHENLQQLKNLLKLEVLPYRIECFDNSHMSATHSVGVMIVYENNHFVNASKRTYILNAKSEYEQMKELLTRRVLRFDENPPPNLWLIDGGETLRQLAIDIIESAGVNLSVVAISKDRLVSKTKRSKGFANDKIYYQGGKVSIAGNNKSFLLLQRIRDEAHKTAVNFHRKRKLASDKQISLLNIKGIGNFKLKKILQYFGNFENIKKASLEDLQAVLNKNDAMNLYEFLKNGSQT